jgi:hypothetical protein
MHLILPHKFTQAEATVRVKRVLSDTKPQLEGKATIEEERWEGNILHFAFTAQGQNVTGQLEVRDNEFVLDATLPLVLRMFEGRIEKMIAEQSKQMLG